MAHPDACQEFDPTNPADYAALEGLIHAAQMEEDLRIEGMVEDNDIFAVRVRETLEQSLANKANAFLLYKEGGATKGYIQFRRDLRQKTVWVETVYVSTPYRGSGVARCLIECVEQQALSEGAHKIRVYTPKKNVRAQGTYKKLGFKVVPTHYIGLEKNLHN
jgi:ribosomal protein S18 acetylase RimI-like enzyme